jgi:hypothetical protein
MNNIPDNIRLKELAIIANSNKPFFDDFIDSLKSHEFIHIDKNPNQITEVEPILNNKLKEILQIFQSIE